MFKLVFCVVLFIVATVYGASERLNQLDSDFTSRKLAIKELQANFSKLKDIADKEDTALVVTNNVLLKRHMIDSLLKVIDSLRCEQRKNKFEQGEEQWKEQWKERLSQDSMDLLHKQQIENKHKVMLLVKYKKSPYKKDIVNGHIRIGMTKEMVIDSWGRPEDVNRTVGQWGVHEQWVYGGTYLYFDNGRLTCFQD